MKSNKPIPAIIRFREKFTIKTKEGLNLDDGKNIYAGSRGLTEDIETFLVAELLNERERIADKYEQAIEASYFYLKPNNDAYNYVQANRKRIIKLRERLLKSGTDINDGSKSEKEGGE